MSPTSTNPKSRIQLPWSFEMQIFVLYISSDEEKTVGHTAIASPS
jgi:hypothetical protein